LRNIDQVIGTTKEEKVANLNNLVYNLSQIVDMDLSDISGEGIIFEEDRKSVRRLLELILEIIYTMNDVNGSHNDTISNNEKILSDSNIRHEEINSELNYVENSNRNNRNSQLQNQILTSQSNSNFYVNESRDSNVIDNENEKGIKSTNRSNKISNSVSASNINPISNTYNLKNSKSNGFSNSNINFNNLEKMNENFEDEKILSNRNQNVTEIDDEGQEQYYDLGDHQLSKI
jgi:hypothetical protein